MEDERLSVSALQENVTPHLQEDPPIEDMKILISEAPVHVDRWETSMHLYVKCNQVEALKALVEEMTKEQISVLVNSKDCEGNTVLHIAVSNKYSGIINYLLTLNGLRVNALNKNGLTALDVLTQSPAEHSDIEIERSLRNAGGSSVEDLHQITDDWLQGKDGRATNKPSDWVLDRNIERALVVMALVVVGFCVATVAFQAGLSLPRILQDNCKVDTEIVSDMMTFYRDPKWCAILLIFSRAVMLLLVSIVLFLGTMEESVWVFWQMVVMFFSVVLQVVSYVCLPTIPGPGQC